MKTVKQARREVREARERLASAEFHKGGTGYDCDVPTPIAELERDLRRAQEVLSAVLAIQGLHIQ